MTDELDLTSISHPRPTLPYVVMQLRGALETGKLSEVWQSVYQYYLEDPYWSKLLKRITKPLIHGNKTERLNEEMTAALIRGNDDFQCVSCRKIL